MSGTSPDTQSAVAPDLGYGVLGPLPAGWVNVQDFGADPTGNDVSSIWLQQAADAIPDDGGVIIFPPGRYLINQPLMVKSGTTIQADGATIVSCAIDEWVASDKFAITNTNNAAAVLTDANITIRGMAFDYLSFETWPSGGIHIIFMWRVSNVNVVDCRFLGGDDHTAFLGCDGTNVEGCYSVGASNCTYDHWNGARNARVSNCYAITGLGSQIVNFNAQNTDLSTNAAEGFILSGCTLISTAAAATPLQIEPLGPAGSSIKNVIISNNILVNCYLVIRGRCDNYIVDGNVFRDVAVRQAIIVNTSVGDTPDAISITNNTIYDPTTTSGLGVIQIVATNYRVTGNSVFGAGYGVNPGINTSGSSAGGIVYGNYVSNGVISLTVNDVGTVGMNMAVNDALGWYDNADTRARMFVQSSDNNFVFSGTDAAGAARAIWSVIMRSSVSELTTSVPLLINGTWRTSVSTLAAAGTAIGTATAITGNLTNVTTCTAGVADGVRLAATIGREQIVINSTADTLKVYPNNSGAAQIDAGGASVPAAIAAGKSKTFVQVASNDFRTIAAT